MKELKLIESCARILCELDVTCNYAMLNGVVAMLTQTWANTPVLIECDALECALLVIDNATDDYAKTCEYFDTIQVMRTIHAEAKKVVEICRDLNA